MVKIFKPANYVSAHTDAELIEIDARVDSAGNAEVTNVDGILFSDDGLFESDLHDPIVENWRVGDISDGIGEWMAVARDKSTGSHLVFADAAGFCPVFYALVPGRGVVAASSFYGALAGIESLGGSVKLDVGNYAAALSSSHVMFLNPTVWRTMAEEIRILKPGEALAIDGDRVRLVPRLTLSSSSERAIEDEYEGCLVAGLTMARNSLRSLAQRGDDIDRVLYLSGGVDSRLVLALLVEAGVEKEFSVFSSDPRSAPNDQVRRDREADLKIANTLREHYGMGWWVRGDRKDGVMFDFRESLAMTQGIRSNFEYEGIPTYGMSVPLKTAVTLRGGGGEVLRGSWERLELLASAVGDRAGTELTDPSDRLSAWYRNQGMISFDGDDVVAGLLNRFLKGLGATSDRELIVKYFQQTRNRTHFGHSRFTRPSNGFALNPLTNRYFLRAAELLDYDELSQGKLVKDIFQRCAPELLEFPFDNPWTNSWLLAVDEPRPLASFDGAEEYFGLLDKSNVRTSRSTKIEKDPVRYRKFDPEQSGRQYLKRAFAEIEKRSPQSISLLQSLHQEVWKALDSGRARLPHLVVKAASAIDVFFPMIRNGAGVTILNSARSSEYDFQVDVEPWLLPLDGWNELGIVDHAPKLDLVSNRLALDPGARNFAFSSGSLRYELSVDGKIVEVRNTDGISRIVFDWEPLNFKTIVVRAFEIDAWQDENENPIWQVSMS